MCLLCLHHIREQLNGKCPACRTPYSEKNFVIDKVDPEAAAREVRERAEAKKAREKRDRAAAAERERAAAAAASQAKAKTTFKHVRVVQRNLVYVIGLSLSLAREEALKRTQMFGRFGRINRVLVNRGHPYNADAPGGPSIAAYILFARDTDASTAARVMNGEVFDGRELRCAIATTKYCDAFIRHGTLVLSISCACVFPRPVFLRLRAGRPPLSPPIGHMYIWFVWSRLLTISCSVVLVLLDVCMSIVVVCL